MEAVSAPMLLESARNRVYPRHRRIPTSTMEHLDQGHDMIRSQENIRHQSVENSSLHCTSRKLPNCP